MSEWHDNLPYSTRVTLGLEPDPRDAQIVELTAERDAARQDADELRHSIKAHKNALDNIRSYFPHPDDGPNRERNLHLLLAVEEDRLHAHIASPKSADQREGKQ